VARLLDRREVEMNAQRSEACEAISAPARRQKKGRRSPQLFPSRTGLLLDPQLQKKRVKMRVHPKKTHYTQETFNSLRRQQPPVECAVSFCTPAHAQSSILNSSVVRSCQVALTFSPKEEQRRTCQSNVEKPVLQGKLRNKEEKSSVCEESMKGAVGGEECPVRVAIHQENSAMDSLGGGVVQELTSVIARQSNQLESLQSEIATKLAELKTELRTNVSAPMQVGVSEEKPGVDKKEQPVSRGDPAKAGPVAMEDAVLSGDPASTSPVMSGSVSNGTCGGITNNVVPEIRALETGVPGNVPVLGSKPEVSLMLRRLNELEAEEDEISRRWTSVRYEDLSYRNPQHRVQPCFKPHPHPRHQESPTAPSPSSGPPTWITSSSGVDKEVLFEYKECYSRYLENTGLTTRGGFDPWLVAERWVRNEQLGGGWRKYV